MQLDDDLLITTTLLRRFFDEAQVDDGNGQFYALIRKQDAKLLSHHPGSPQLDPLQVMWGAEVLERLNRELHHDGAWVLVFTHPVPPELRVYLPNHIEYGRYALIWIDEDGDPQFTMEWSRGDSAGLIDFAAVVGAGILSTAQKAETSWQLWNHHMREVLDPSEGQLLKRAQGQTSH